MPIHSGLQFVREMPGGLARFMDERGRLSFNQLRPPVMPVRNSALTRDQWLELDSVVMETFRTVPTGVNDLINAGLTTPGDLGTILSGYPVVSDMEAAQMSMDGVVHGQQDRLDYDEVLVPIPITHKDFGLSARHLLTGAGRLQTDHVREATKKVRDLNENILFGNATYNYGGYSVWGYTNHPNRVTDTATNFGGGDWGTSGNAYKTIVGAINYMAALGLNGPWGVYAANVQYGQTLLQFGNNDNNELSVMLEKIPDLQFLRRSFELTAGEVVMVMLAREAIDVEVAANIQVVQWSERGGFLTEYRVLDAIVPRIKKDYNDVVAICHITGA